jgi:hypothetical protein
MPSAAVVSPIGARRRQHALSDLRPDIRQPPGAGMSYCDDVARIIGVSVTIAMGLLALVVPA